MNPSEHETDDANPIADRNTERLLAGAYRPETPDPDFLARVTAAMHAAAVAAAKPAPPARGSRHSSAAMRWIGWTAAAALLVSLGVLVGTRLTPPANPRQDKTVGVDGKVDVEAGATVKDQEASAGDSPTPKSHLKAGLQPAEDRLKAGLQPAGVPPLGGLKATGTVALQQPAAGTAAPRASAAETLQVGQSAETNSGQRRRLALADGSILYLNQNTAVTLAADRQVTLRHGEIYVEVAQDPAAARFIVSAPGRQMVALGTKFDVRVAHEGTELLVAQGKVQVSGREQPVLAGQQLTLDGPAAGPAEISAAPRTTHTIEWTRELMAAARSPLVPGSRYSGGSLVAVDPQGQETRLSLRKYRVDVHIEDGFARTTIDQTYFNHEPYRLEGTFYFPLPPDASLSRLAMYVNGRLMEGGMAERQHAREVFDSIVTRMKDPALLEWVDGSTFKMRVFPLEGRQEKRIVLSYTQRLASLYGRSEYRFPGGHSLPVIGDWSAHVCVKQGCRIGFQPVIPECEPQFTATTRDGDLLLDAAAKDIRPDRDIVVRMNESPLSLRERVRVRGSGITSSTGELSGKLPSPSGRGAGGEGGLRSTKAKSSYVGPITARPHPSPLPEGEGTVSSSPLPAPCFSSAVADGSKYLMLRWRPDLPGNKVRQRRDWIFLFESSGDRDPLLARTQIEIVKTILDNAEHDDTFTILTAATRVHACQATPQTATPENVRQAVRVLENVHLVGALDLGRVFDAARPLVEAAENPVLVHVGSGLPVLGPRDPDALVKRMPPRAVYVGVGVGNRWSRALMKAAAARSGGHFTQINPNEHIAWRAMELLATLNTPRLVGIHVGRAFQPDGQARAPCTHGRPDVQFLACEDSVAQGEELCAIARLDAAAEMPKTVEISGQLGGKPQKWTLPVAGVVEHADYLPRTWAKLEIDRLVADGAEKNKARIVELSKAMYVMSPFTSLLVLENEEMYVQYHVDRGRKDHWAMYACPEKIPVVTEPLVGPQNPSGKAEAKGPTAEEVLSTVLVRLPPPILGRPNARRFNGVLTVPIVAPADSPWDVDNLMFGVGVNSDAGLLGNITLDEDATIIVGSYVGTGGPLAMRWRTRSQGETVKVGGAELVLYVAAGDGVGPGKVYQVEGHDGRVMGKENFDDIMAFRVARQKAFIDALYQSERSQFPYPDDPPIVYPDAELWRELTARRKERYSATELLHRTPAEWRIAQALRQPTQIEFVETPLKDVIDYLKDLHHIEIQLDSAALKEAGIDENTPVTKNLRGISLRSALKLLLDELQLKYVIHNEVLLITSPAKAESDEYLTTKVYPVSDLVLPIRMGRVPYLNRLFNNMGVGRDTSSLMMMVAPRIIIQEEEEDRLGVGGMGAGTIREPDSAEMFPWILPGFNRTVPTYQPPVFSNNSAVFYDLAGYAPAMRTNLADILGVLEAEVPANAASKLGKIDDRARRLIERARGAGWQTATIADPHSKTPLTVAFDGTGRYRYERTTSAGLREQVVCDGTSLWHFYPELGIGTRRTANRFHRAAFTRLVPWALPPAEDLARDGDLVMVDERTVAVVPPMECGGLPPLSNTASPERTPRVLKSDGKPSHSKGCLSAQANRISTHLIFAPDGRLAERQLVELPSGKILARESYAADGTVEFVAGEKGNKAGGTPAPQVKDAGGTPTLQRKIVLAPCGAPELKPDAALVVLPLPLRGRQQVLDVRKLAGNENFGSWSEDDALALVAADLGEYPAEMKQIIGQRFFRRGDRRLGFYALLLSTGQTWNPKEKQAFHFGDPLMVDPLADHPHEPLAQYVTAYLDCSRAKMIEARRASEGTGPASSLALRASMADAGPHNFFRQLAEFHDLWERWHDGRATQGDDAQRRQERQRAAAFVQQAQSPELAWGLLMAVRGVLDDRDFCDSFATTIPRFETVPGLEYAARYELARTFLNSGDWSQACDRFCRLFDETLDAGLVPPIDNSFRQALLQAGGNPQWQATIRAAARKLIDGGARLSTAYLAGEVQQLGDPDLAEVIFEMALRDAPENERWVLTLARIEHFRQTKQLPRADALLQSLLNDKRYAGWPALWYLAEAIADARGMTARAIGFRQRAMDIEFAELPETVNVEAVRDDYGRLMARYERLAAAIGALHEAAPRELLAGVIRAADHWRQLDSDPTAACQAAARILDDLGETDLAWDYLTTPLAVASGEAADWASLARTLRQQGHVDLADRAYVAACAAEPANAQVLWDRAEMLWENGRLEQARPLFQRIAAGPWDPQFSELQGRAKRYVQK